MGSVRGLGYTRCMAPRLVPQMPPSTRRNRMLRHVKEIVPWFGGRYKLAMRDHAASEVAVSRTQARMLRAKLRW